MLRALQTEQKADLCAGGGIQCVSTRQRRQAAASLPRSNETRQRAGWQRDPGHCPPAASIAKGISPGRDARERTNHAVGVCRKLPPGAREEHGTRRTSLRIHVGARGTGDSVICLREAQPPPSPRTELSWQDLIFSFTCLFAKCLRAVLFESFFFLLFLCHCHGNM